MFSKTTLSNPPFILTIQEKTDFYNLFVAISLEYKNCFLFESLGNFSNERYCIIGFSPEHIFSAKGNDFYIDGELFQTKNPYSELQKILPNNNFGQKYRGGLFGYIGFDSINYFEPTLNLKAHCDFDTFRFGLYLDGIVLDKLTGQIEYFYYKKNRISEIQKIIKNQNDLVSDTRTASMDKTKVLPTPQQATEYCSTNKQVLKVKTKNLGQNITFDEFQNSFKKIQVEIENGNTFQTVLSLKNKYKIEGNPQLIYEKLREINPSPYMYYLQFEEQTLLGSSPELLLRLRDGLAETFPLAGSIKRGLNEKEDQLLAKDLLNNPKEIAEHNMLVDLHRNDLGKVCDFGTVKIQKLKEITKFSHIQHIASRIIGILKGGEDMFSAFKANFPAGTLSGAPKIETIKIINDLETESRGPYGGGVGYFGVNGDCDFCIAIRSLFISGELGFTQAGAGIVLDSTAQGEYNEIQKKLAALSKVLEASESKI